MRNASNAPLRGGLATLALLGALLHAPDARGYCRTTACGETPGQACVPPSPSDCGTPLFWGVPCFGFSIQEDASSQVDLTTAEALASQAFSAWSQAPCEGGGQPSIAVRNIGTVSCSAPEYNKRAGNANAIIFRNDGWPYTGQGRTLALTTVTYDLDTGEIFDADLEVNATDLDLTTGDDGVEYDLLSILTHETGHMLGIAHTPVSEATMYIEYIPGDTSLRDLHPDDVAAICDAYPPAEQEDSCEPTPRRGFKSDCGDAPREGEGCSCRLGRPAGSGAQGLLVLVGFILLALRRR